MKQLFRTLLCLYVAMGSLGCAMCYTPYDDHYNAFGGVVERQDRVRGRAGSILSDAVGPVSDISSLGESATETDLYRLDSETPYLESIEPLEPTPADLDL